MPLILWDVDLTLLRSGQAGVDAIRDALEGALGRPVTADRVSMAGKTDPQIVRELLQLADVAADEHDAHLPAILAAMHDGLLGARERIAEEGYVMPGVREALERLARTPGVVQTLLTGNIRPNAEVKIGAFGLDRWLDLDSGAYGSDSAHRPDLVPIAVRRAERNHGRTFPADETWVIGDTPLDLACARAGGVRCALVATGHFSYEALVEAGADHVFRDLSDTDEVVRVVTESTERTESRESTASPENAESLDTSRT